MAILAFAIDSVRESWNRVPPSVWAISHYKKGLRRSQEPVGHYLNRVTFDEASDHSHVLQVFHGVFTGSLHDAGEML